MEHTFKKSDLAYLDTVVQEVQSEEQTQEIRLPDSMPDIGRVVAAWGQPILRGKEWRSVGIAASCAMMVWVLYAPEDGGAERCVSGWIPFPVKWDLPEGTPEGTIRIGCLTRFVDARTVSPRKMMVRAGMSVLMQAMSPKSCWVFAPEARAEGVEYLEKTYPLRLNREAGEKSFSLDEELVLPDSAPQIEKIIRYSIDPKVTDKKVLGSKAVFRGNACVHLLYRSEEDQLHSWDFEVPFSQYAPLEQEHGPQAQADILLMPTGAELEKDDAGHLRLKGGMVAQYVISDVQMLSIAQDAYSPGSEVTLRSEELSLPVVLENRKENLFGEQTLQQEANLAADVQFLPDYPRIYRKEEGIKLDMPGIFQILYYDKDSVLRSGNLRWEGELLLPAGEGARMSARPSQGSVRAAVGNGQITVKAELPMELQSTAQQQFTMLTGLETGKAVAADPGRPTLILQRAGGSSLWEIAKQTGSTPDAIRRANGLKEEPEAQQMLLIPVI